MDISLPFYIVVKTLNSVVKIENLMVIHKLQPGKSNSVKGTFLKPC